MTTQDAQKPKATSTSVQAILDRVEKISQSDKAMKKAEMDRLRRVAETVRSDFVVEDLIRSISEAKETSSETQPLEPAASRDGTTKSEVAASPNTMPAPIKTLAYASQMQAYRENA